MISKGMEMNNEKWKQQYYTTMANVQHHNHYFTNFTNISHIIKIFSFQCILNMRLAYNLLHRVSSIFKSPMIYCRLIKSNQQTSVSRPGMNFVAIQHTFRSFVRMLWHEAQHSNLSSDRHSFTFYIPKKITQKTVLYLIRVQEFYSTTTVTPYNQ